MLKEHLRYLEQVFSIKVQINILGFRVKRKNQNYYFIVLMEEKGKCIHSFSLSSPSFLLLFSLLFLFSIF